MIIPAPARPVSRITRISLCLALALVPGRVAAAVQARLVHCGSATCLRLSGHRPDSAVAIRIAGNDLAVAGGRSWHAIVPIEAARNWANASGDRLLLTLIDMRTGTTRMDSVEVPPGALGKRIELAALIVSAH